jgi:hypothetical protein
VIGITDVDNVSKLSFRNLLSLDSNRAMPAFDETYTDGDFQSRINEAKTEWMDEMARHEPDLTVEGLRGSFMSRLMSLFGAR